MYILCIVMIIYLYKYIYLYIYMYIYIWWASPAVEKQINTLSWVQYLALPIISILYTYRYHDIHDTDVFSLPSRQLGSCHSQLIILHSLQHPFTVHICWQLACPQNGPFQGSISVWVFPALAPYDWHSYWTSRYWIGKSLIKGPFSIATLIEIDHRRKFRSQTSDNMDRWKAEQGRGRETRDSREKIREEKESEESTCRCAKR